MNTAEVLAAIRAAGYVLRIAEETAVRAMLRPNGGIRAALLEGLPGCGKTALPEAVAKAAGARLVYGLLHSWSDDQELCCGIDVAAAVEGDASRVRQPGVLAVAAEESQAGLVVLCLDELDKVQERTENLLLDFLQTGRVPIRPTVHLQARAENLLVFLTSNAQREFSDAILRRVRRVRMQPLPADTVVRLAAARAGVPVGVVRMAWKAGAAIAGADEAQLSLQELAHLSQDLWLEARTAVEVREFLGQWVARGAAGATMAARGATDEVAALWGEISAERRRGHP